MKKKNLDNSLVQKCVLCMFYVEWASEGQKNLKGYIGILKTCQGRITGNKLGMFMPCKINPRQWSRWRGSQQISLHDPRYRPQHWINWYTLLAPIRHALFSLAHSLITWVQQALNNQSHHCHCTLAYIIVWWLTLTPPPPPPRFHSHLSNSLINLRLK